MTSSSTRQRQVAAAGGGAACICDGCKDRRARWYCAADEAFLCQVCDASVHSANPLARRHHRLQINAIEAQTGNATDPAWHQFKRKPRTPRHHHHAKRQCVVPVQPLVPELEVPADENNEEEESQLLYRVPIFDPEFFPLLDDHKSAIQLPNISHPVTTTNATATDSEGPFMTEFDMEDFSANIDSLLGGESFCKQELGLVDSMDGEVRDYCLGESLEVKPEIGEDNIIPHIYREGKVNSPEIGRITEEDNSSETLEFDFADCGSPEAKNDSVAAEQSETRMSLRLDYDAIIAEWSGTHGSSPWIDGHRPQLGADEYFWPDYMQQNMWNGGVPAHIEGGVDDRGREARVLRYREKRRKRLYSKKIRYEVRKLNAEKRPRMKGRFVKKSNLAPRPTV